MIQAGLVAGDTGIDLFRCPPLCLFNKGRVGQEGTGHADHIRLAAAEDLFGRFGHVDAIDCRDGDARQGIFNPRSGPGKSATGNRLGDGRGACFMPADAGIDDIGPCGFNPLCQLAHF